MFPDGPWATVDLTELLFPELREKIHGATRRVSAQRPRKFYSFASTSPGQRGVDTAKALKEPREKASMVNALPNAVLSKAL